MERDRFHAKKDTLKTVAEHDPLTRLYNRCAVDLRFDALRKDGSDTFALVDLDRFKDINDRYGHLVGDAVLEAGGRSLVESDNDCVAIRLGGEEFMVILRGPIRCSVPKRYGRLSRAGLPPTCPILAGW